MSEPKPQSNGNGVDGRVLHLNVGGIHYCTTRTLLCSAGPDSLLSVMMTERWMENCPKDADGRIFIDRNGDVFNDILRYLRSGPSFIASYAGSPQRLELLREEADYFNLPELVEAISGRPVRLWNNEWACVAAKPTEEGQGWGWTQERGNPSILKSLDGAKMVVGESGTFILLLRLHCVLPLRIDSKRDRSLRKRDSLDEFVTVNVENLGPAVATSWREGEEFILVRCGLWDHRTEKERLDDGRPSFGSVTCAEVVTLREGDVLTVSYPYECDPNFASANVFAAGDLSPMPGDAPPSILNSLTLLKVDGNTLSRYERKHDARQASTAVWSRPENDFPSSPFDPRLVDEETALQMPHPGNYLILGRVASGCTSSTFTDEPANRENASCRLCVRSKGGRLLHAVHAVGVYLNSFRGEDVRRRLSENGSFNDIIYIEEEAKLGVYAEGRVMLDDNGLTKASSSHDHVSSQSLSVLLLSEEMQIDRYAANAVRSEDNESDVHVLIWDRCLPTQCSHMSPLVDSCAGSRLVCKEKKTVLLCAAFDGGENEFLALTINGRVVALSETAADGHPRFRRQKHHFQDILELNEGDRIGFHLCGFERGSTGWSNIHLYRLPAGYRGIFGYVSMIELNVQAIGGGESDAISLF